jgi:uncharacterized protein (DUF2062 family)
METSRKSTEQALFRIIPHRFLKLFYRAAVAAAVAAGTANAA